MDVSKLPHHFYVPAFSIQVGDKELLNENVEIFSVSVNNTLKGADDFSFTINNPIDPKGKDFLFLLNGMFSTDFDNPQNKVTIKMGYGDRSKLITVFSGIITAIDVTFPANGVSQMTIKGYDRSHKMMKQQHSDSWGSDNKPVTFSDVVKQIAGKPAYGFGTAHVENTKEKHKQVKQDRQSDFDFIQKKLAEEIGFEVFVFDNDIYFRPRQNISQSFTAELFWRNTLISFSPKINTAKQVSEVQVRGWNPATQQAIIGKATAGSEQGKDAGGRSGGESVASGRGNVKHVWRPVHTQKEADDIAKSILEQIALDYVTGNGECLGLPGDFKDESNETPGIIAGKNVKLSDLGSTFSKTYYIDKVSHSISTSGFKTTFEVTENSINERTI
jgi:uncharacterized protein